MTEYNPFNKDISELDKEDINNLIGKVAEGWFVEYKSSFPSSNQKIAHSIASFANTEGGWYIVGIISEPDTNLAKEISPLDLSSNSQPKDKIRNIVTNSINPKPFFESKLINISDNEGVLVVYIAKGEETPYVTNDGRIYERVGEGSDPIYLQNHYSLQKLFERSKEFNLQIEHFSKNPFIKSLDQYQDQCTLEAYFYIPSSYGFEFDHFYSEEFFEEIKKNFTTDVKLMEEVDASMTFKFDNFYSNSSSYILRYLEPYDPLHLGLTIELFSNGNMKLILPLNEINLIDNEYIPSSYKDSDNLKEFINVLNSQTDMQSLKIIDGFITFLIIMALFNQYCKLLRNNNFKGILKTRLKVLNCNRTILYFDDEEYINFIKVNNLPISLKSVIEIPNFLNGDAMSFNLTYGTHALIFVKMAESLGVPISYLKKITGNGLGGYMYKHMHPSEE